MEAESEQSVSPQPVVVRLWAGARAAAGTPQVVVDVPGPVSVDWVKKELVRRLPMQPRLSDVLDVCSVLVGDRPLGKADPASVEVQPGSSVEFLPPFAGG
jgi:molybdopterin converting factor small subunit